MPLADLSTIDIINASPASVSLTILGRGYYTVRHSGSSNSANSSGKTDEKAARNQAGV
jgi:hypothetical protein